MADAVIFKSTGRPDYLRLALPLMFTAIGFWMLKTGGRGGWFVLVVFGLALIIQILSVLPSSHYLQFDEKGLTIVFMHMKNFIPWEDIERIEQEEGLIFIAFTNPEKYRTAFSRRNMIATSQGGTLVSCYNVTAEELKGVLQQWKK